MELTSGRSVKQIAAANGVSRNTVRTQIQRILEKTGTSRQAEAVALVARLGFVRP